MGCRRESVCSAWELCSGVVMAVTRLVIIGSSSAGGWGALGLPCKMWEAFSLGPRMTRNSA